MLTIVIIAVTAIIAILGIVLLLRIILDKGKQVFNPIKKDNSDYRFLQVKNEKTRDIFLK